MPVVVQPVAGQATVHPSGELRVKEEPTQLLVDTFDASFDTVNLWNAGVAANGGTAATYVGAAFTIASGASVNGYSYVRSIDTFKPLAPGYNQFEANINLSAGQANTRSAWGAGLGPAAPTTAAGNFMTDAFAFEVQEATGKLFAATYVGGTRTVIQDLSAASGNGTQPSDLTQVHKYWIDYRGDIAYWFIDSRDNLVATMPSGASGPNVNALPIFFRVVNPGSGTVGSQTLQVNAVFLADTARNSLAISDGTYPRIKKKVFYTGPSAMANCSGYTTISTLGTTTIQQPGGGVFFGVNVLSTGTAAMVVQAFDIVVSGTTTTTNTLTPAVTPGALGFAAAPGASGVGVRFNGFLAIVTTGTAGTYNTLWD